jgi:hypothetical protein
MTDAEIAEIGRQNMADTWAAMVAMRDTINEHVPMPSVESDLLQGPENSVFCATLAEAVVSEVLRLKALANPDRMPSRGTRA